MPSPPPAGVPSARSCRRAPRPLAPGSLRPTDLLGAFFLTGLVFLLAGGAVAVLDAFGALGWYGHWLALHLVLLGGVSLLVLGAGQFFCTAFLATDPPPQRMVRAQLGAWTVGTVLVAIGIPAREPVLTDIGGAAVIGGLVLFATSLWRLERRSLQQARWAVRWYYACAASLGLGVVVGLLMARGTAWPYGSLLGAHLTLNLAGWLGTAIVGTLHTFYPSLTHSALGHPRLQAPTFTAWTLGVGALAGGWAFDLAAVLTAGWAALAVAAALLAVNIVGCARTAVGPLGLAPRLVGAGQAFLPAGMLVAVISLVMDGPQGPLSGGWRPTLAVLLLAGWIGLTVSGSLMHLLAVLQRVRNLARAMPAPSPRRDRSLTRLAMVAVFALAASHAPGLGALAGPATIAALAAAGLVAARILALAFGAVRFAHLRL